MPSSRASRLTACFIDGDAALGHLEEAGIAPVADDGFGPCCSMVCSQLVQDGLPGRGVFLGLHGVAADHVAPVSHPDLLDLQVVLHRLVASGAGQDLLLDLLLPAHPAAQDVVERRLLVSGQQLDGILGDHAPVRHHRDPADLKPLPQQRHHSPQGLLVRSVAGEDLPGDGPAVRR